MKKRDVTVLMAGTLSALLIASGMCMILISGWNLKTEGIAFTAAGLITGIASLLYTTAGNRKAVMSKRTLSIVLLSLSGALTLGGGMSLVMVWGEIFWGIVLGIPGILLLMMLIPVISGVEKEEK